VINYSFIVPLLAVINLKSDRNPKVNCFKHLSPLCKFLFLLLLPKKMTMYDPMAESSKDLRFQTDSLSVTETVNGAHHFELKGYSLTKGMGIGKFIASETFTVGGHQWAIYFYPDGKVPTENGFHVSVFVALVSNSTNVRALFELKMHDQSGRGNDLVYTHFGRNLENGPYTIRACGCIWLDRLSIFFLSCLHFPFLLTIFEI